MSYDPQNSGEGTSLPDTAAPALTRRQMRELERAAQITSAPEDALAAEMEKQVATYVPPAIPTAQQVAAASTPIHEVVPEAIVEPVAEAVIAPAPVEPVVVAPQISAEVPAEPVHVPTRKSQRVPLKHVVVRHQKAPKTRSSSKQETTTPQQPKRSIMQRVLVAAVLLTCGAFMLATSIPANALLSESEVQRIKMETFLADQVAKSGQSIFVSEDGTQAISASRDGIDVTLAKQPSTTLGSAGAIFGGNRIETNVPPSSGPIVWPLSSVRVSSPYGYRWGALHAGLDMDPNEGTPIMAVADGIVAAVYPAGSSSFGNCTIIDHNVNGVKFSSLYAHQSAVNVSVGQSVSAGQVIGAVGNTGNSTGAHLHLEIHVDNTAIDPYPFMLQYAGSPPS